MRNFQLTPFFMIENEYHSQKEAFKNYNFSNTPEDPQYGKNCGENKLLDQMTLDFKF